MTKSRLRYQQGSLTKQRRAKGPSEWVFRYRVTLDDGRRVQRQVVIGNTQKYKTESEAQKAADAVRQTINSMSPAAQVPTVGLVAQHFKDVELNEANQRRSWSGKQNYKEMLNLFILPRWATIRMLDVKSVAVEAWLGTLVSTTMNKKALENPTKQRIRNVFSVLFTHGQRYEFVPIGHNPIKLVRQSGKRSRIPDILEPSEIRALLEGSEPREKAAIALNFGNGLRRSEGFALKWPDINFVNGTASVVRGIVKGHVGDVKTEISKKLVPLHPYQLESLAAWRAVSPYCADEDWVFASHRSRGTKPYWPDMILRRHIQPLAKKLGIEKRIGWHTFRRSFASILKANGEDVKVVQELCRHASPGITLGLYAQAFSEDARRAQNKLVEMVCRAPLLPPVQAASA
ncbi:MAG: site-specific integrase [Candidatus Acidiferrum sp.]